jgi:hypothetical protein
LDRMPNANPTRHSIQPYLAWYIGPFFLQTRSKRALSLNPFGRPYRGPTFRKTYLSIKLYRPKGRRHNIPHWHDRYRCCSTAPAPVNDFGFESYCSTVGQEEYSTALACCGVNDRLSKPYLCCNLTVDSSKITDRMSSTALNLSKAEPDAGRRRSAIRNENITIKKSCTYL